MDVVRHPPKERGRLTAYGPDEDETGTVEGTANGWRITTIGSGQMYHVDPAVVV